MEDERNAAHGEELQNGDLEQAAGGWVFFHDDCWFTPTGRQKEENGQLWIECASTCGSGLQCCSCYTNEARCMNKWHTIDRETKILTPLNLANHMDKKPINHYNT